MSQPYQLLAGLLLAILIAGGAYLAGALSRSGMVAAILLGTVVFGLGGLPWAVLLIAFFISSSLLSRLFSRRKERMEEKFSKGHRRDAAQVLANGGIAGLCVLLWQINSRRALALAGIRRGAGGCQRGYVGDRAGRAEQDAAAQHPHGEGGGTGGFGRGEPHGAVCSHRRQFAHRGAGCPALAGNAIGA